MKLYQHTLGYFECKLESEMHPYIKSRLLRQTEYIRMEDKQALGRPDVLVMENEVALLLEVKRHLKFRTYQLNWFWKPVAFGVCYYHKGKVVIVTNIKYKQIVKHFFGEEYG